tara:strand:+ start:228 stop:467 length:240 start_codon:yes stop_codon:yes gene_type:complete
VERVVAVVAAAAAGAAAATAAVQAVQAVQAVLAVLAVGRGCKSVASGSAVLERMHLPPRANVDQKKSTKIHHAVPRLRV